MVKITINIRIDEPIKTAKICLREEKEDEYGKRGENVDEDGMVYACAIRLPCWNSSVARR